MRPSEQELYDITLHELLRWEPDVVKANLRVSVNPISVLNDHPGAYTSEIALDCYCGTNLVNVLEFYLVCNGTVQITRDEIADLIREFIAESIRQYGDCSTDNLAG